jgi:hypothetical protein
LNNTVHEEETIVIVSNKEESPDIFAGTKAAEHHD